MSSHQWPGCSQAVCTTSPWKFNMASCNPLCPQSVLLHGRPHVAGWGKLKSVSLHLILFSSLLQTIANKWTPKKSPECVKTFRTSHHHEVNTDTLLWFILRVHFKHSSLLFSFSECLGPVTWFYNVKRSPVDVSLHPTVHVFLPDFC